MDSFVLCRVSNNDVCVCSFYVLYVMQSEPAIFKYSNKNPANKSIKAVEIYCKFMHISHK